MTRGAKRKPDDQRIRRNIDPIPTQYLEDVGETYGPALPEEYAWHPRTLIWWETWRSSPNAQTFTSTDWDFLLDTALIHTQFWNDKNVGAELRLRVSKFGATPEDRQHLRLQIGNKSEPTDVKPKTSSTSRKTKLLKLVEEVSDKPKAV